MSELYIYLNKHKIIPTMFLTAIHQKALQARIFITYTMILTSSYFQLTICLVLYMKHIIISDEQQSSINFMNVTLITCKQTHTQHQLINLEQAQ